MNEQSGDGDRRPDVGHGGGASESLVVVTGRETNRVSRPLCTVHHLPQAGFTSQRRPVIELCHLVAHINLFQSEHRKDTLCSNARRRHHHHHHHHYLHYIC